MKKYLAELHTKPPHHKKRFAFAVSGLVTLIIFSFWTLATFGTGGTLAQNNEVEKASPNEVSPFQSIKMGAAASIEGIKSTFSGLKNGLSEAVDLEADYTEMKDGVLNTYGQ